MNLTNERKNKTSDRGTTLIEMIVCFALMAIFMSAAAAIIASVTNLYYQVKGETYGRQVSDIIVQKIVAEIDGAQYKSGKILPSISDDGKSIRFKNRSNADVSLKAVNKELMVEYNSTNTDVPISWKFDEKVYYNYEIEELIFVPGNQLSKAPTGYNIDFSSLDYNGNIVLVFMTIDSPKYGTYRTVRPVKMYNVPSDYTWPTN